MILENNQIVEWTWNTALTAAQVLVVPIGGENNVQFIAQGADVLQVTFGLISAGTCTLVLQGDYVGTFATADTLLTIAVLAATYTTPYSLPAPLGQNGWIPVSRPYIRWQLTETTGALQAYTRFYAKAYG